ncbi:triple tyrosine motif-containing protein [Fulvivirga kasyanovii]|uniref:histidine kinase n=1 Tax=Fulvivirga kasyanovii TaxID=396812 RepID=A0ABW9RWQ0_9BACT|nr:ATP-binding protein [Fulvivirga kasyanovii]MTI28456.1 hypothetical protein [Fulvivirga kasyanovii]
MDYLVASWVLTLSNESFKRVISGAMFLLSVYFPLQGQHMFVRDFSQDEYNAGQNYQINQDRHGVIYLANGDGVLTYDGAEWNLLYLPGNLGVDALAIGNNDEIYIGSEGELGYFLKDSSGNYEYRSLLKQLEQKYQSVGIVHKIIIFDNSVFFCDEQRIYIYREGQFKVLNIKTSLFKSLFVVGSHLFISSQDNKFYEYSKAGLRLLRINPNVSIWDITPYGQHKGIILDSQNHLWIFDTKSPEGQWELLPGNYLEHLGNEQIVGVKYLRKDQIALFTIHEVLFINENGEVKSDISPDFSEDYFYQDALLDKECNLWVVSPTKISLVSTSSPLLFLDNSDGFKGQILAIQKNGEYEYLGTEWGVYYRKGNGSFKVLPKTYSAETWGFYHSNKQVYAASSFGVFELEEEKATAITEHDYVMAICGFKKDSNTLIFSTYNTGIWLLKKQNGQWKKKKIKGFDESLSTLYEDSEQNIWAHNPYTGIWKLRLNKQMDSVIHQELYNNQAGLPSNLNNRLYQLKTGKIITTTVNGMYSYNKETNSFVAEDSMNKAFPKSTCIYSIAENDKGDLYFWGSVSPEQATAGVLKKQDNGQYHLPTTPFKKIAEKIRKNSVDTQIPIFVAGPEEIWIGSKKRLIIYNPKQETFYDKSIHLRLREVWSKDSLVFSYGQKISNVHIPYSRNNLHFEFTSTFHESAKENTYQYKLAGFDDGWSSWSHSTKTNFTNLPEGKYTFTVRTKNVYGNISKPVYFTFYINAPWYRTLGAYVIYLLLIGLLVYMVIRAKTKKVERQKILLENEVRKKTGELLAMNDHINNKNIEIARQAEELKELNFTKDKIFSVISHDLRGSVKQIPELLNLLDSGYISLDEFKSLLPNLKEASKNLSSLTENLLQWAKCQMKGIEVKKSEFKLSDIVDETLRLIKSHADKKCLQLISNVDKELSVFADKDMIRLLLRNLINNAVKFTPKNGVITIRSEVKGSFIHISVIDTGVGLTNEEIDRILGREFFTKHGTAGEKGSGLGLMLCKEFAELHGGKLIIEGKPGEGSTFTFTIIH